MLLVRTFATKTSQFGYSGPSTDLIEHDDDLSALLADLGCTMTLDELRAMKEERFRDLGDKIASAGISTVELF